jgi:hypothetical protein
VLEEHGEFGSVSLAFAVFVRVVERLDKRAVTQCETESLILIGMRETVIAMRGYAARLLHCVTMFDDHQRGHLSSQEGLPKA